MAKQTSMSCVSYFLSFSLYFLLTLSIDQLEWRFLHSLSSLLPTDRPTGNPFPLNFCGPGVLVRPLPRRLTSRQYQFMLAANRPCFAGASSLSQLRSVVRPLTFPKYYHPRTQDASELPCADRGGYTDLMKYIILT